MTDERRWIIGLIGALVVASVGLYAYSDIDTAVSRLFWQGDHFPLAKGQKAAVLADGLHYGLRAVFLVYVVATPILLIRRQMSALAWRKYIFVLLCVGLAAGLVTNVVLKDHWGRARPNQIAEFGGVAQFTPAWAISDQCRKNCSFVGGDVSFAFCALAPALLVPRRRRWIVAVVALGGVTSLVRLAAGGHFLSDCLISALLTALIVLGLKQILKPGS